MDTALFWLSCGILQNGYNVQLDLQGIIRMQLMTWTFWWCLFWTQVSQELVECREHWPLIQKHWAKKEVK